MKIRPLIPTLYAVILFIAIRMANDIPRGADYYGIHSVKFIILEMAGVVTGSYLSFFLAGKWISLCSRKHYGATVEYVAVFVVPLLLVLAIMTLSHGPEVFRNIGEIITPALMTVTMGIGLYANMKSRYVERLYHKESLNNERMRTEQLRTELELLRTQYHPHFLFNMLNTVYFSINESDEKARSIVEHLANLLRSQLYSGDGKVSINHEISVLDSYIRLSSLRIGERISVHVDIDPTLEREEIYPHLLMPPVENAFKHCCSPGVISIELYRVAVGIELKIKNSVSSDTRPEGRGGLGLRNLRKRLGLLYPDGHHNLVVNAGEKEYIVTLRLYL